MEFFLRLDPDQMNLVLKGLEILREGASNVHTYVVQQISAQAQQRQASPVPPMSPSMGDSSVATDIASPSEAPLVAPSEPSSAPAT